MHNATTFNQLTSTAKTAYLAGINVNQAQRLLNVMEAEIYWFGREPGWYKADDLGRGRKFHSDMKQQVRRLSKRLKRGTFSPELSPNGSIVTRTTSEFRGWDYIYFYLENRSYGEWELYLQDNGYHMLFCNRETLQIYEYTEGDVFLLACPDDRAFTRDLRWLASAF